MALRLADALAGQGRRAIIINADSMQVYRDIPVVSAAPDAQEAARHPHSLYGAWDGAAACSAADWAGRAKEEIARAHAQGAVPILVGGTGMYIRVLLEGIAPIPAIDPEIREQVRALAVSEAYTALQGEDPERASQLDAGDSQRIARALEVVRSTGQPLAHWQSRLEGGIGADIDLHPLVMLPDRVWLRERCDRRFVHMLDGGAIDEVERLLARNLDPDLPVMRAIGVPEIAGLVRSEWTRAEATERGQAATRQYAKRQYTWFRRQPPENWQRAIENLSDPHPYFVSLLQEMH